MWIANFLISLFFPILLAWLGLSGTFFIFAGIGVFGAIFVINAYRKLATVVLNKSSTICGISWTPVKKGRPPGPGE